MKKVLKSLFGLLLVSTLACATVSHTTTLAEERFASTKEAVVRMAYDSGSCTAFHVGDQKFITAEHCLGAERKLDDIILIDQKGNEHLAVVLLEDASQDVAVLFAETFRGPKLEFWDDKVDGELRPGTEIMTVGYPGYYFIRLTFEIGHIRETNFDLIGRRLISSRDSVFRGQSGGPTIAMKNGKVIGMNDALIENIDQLSPFRHQHGSISLYVPYDILADALKKSPNKWLPPRGPRL